MTNAEVNKKPDWESLYPLNTFKGETKKELIDFITSQIALAERRGAEALGEKIKNMSGKRPSKDINIGWEDWDDGFDWAIKSVLELLVDSKEEE